MLKKTLAILLASIFALGMFSVVASAEEIEEPAYVPVEYKIEDIVAAVEAKKDVILNPTDTIVLPEVEEQEEGVAAQADVSQVLIVEYRAGKGAASVKKVEKFVEYKGTGYEVLGIGGKPEYSYVNGTRQTGNAIDYANEEGYAFKNWKVTSAYSGPEFNRVILEAEWDVPALTGWAGYKTLMRGYVKTVIDYIINYLADMFARIGEFLV